MPHPLVLSTAVATTESPPSPAQARFHALVQEIERARALLATWRERGAAHDAAVTPVVDAYFALLREWIVALDVTLGQRPWSRQHRDQLRALLRDAVVEWIDAEGDDPPLRALHDRHGDTELGTRRARDDEPPQAGADAPSSLTDGSRPAEAVHSMRAVYRRLASALHPDRERDATERVVKTAMMQRVNQAYDAQDLLTLLALQGEVAPTAGQPFLAASEEQLAHYNEVLAGQRDRLTDAVRDEAARYRDPAAPEPVDMVDVDGIDAVLGEAAQAWADGVAELRRNVLMLRSATATKQWLAAMRFDPRGALR